MVAYVNGMISQYGDSIPNKEGVNKLPVYLNRYNHLSIVYIYFFYRTDICADFRFVYNLSLTEFTTQTFLNIWQRRFHHLVETKDIKLGKYDVCTAIKQQKERLKSEYDIEE